MDLPPLGFRQWKNQMKVTVEGKKGSEELVIRLPLEQEPEESSTGKTLIVASSHGGKASGVDFQGREVIVSVNAYSYKSGKKKAARSLPRP